MNILAFDIEIANVFTIKPGTDLDDYGPFDISVAATHARASGGRAGEERLWLTKTSSGTPAPSLARVDALQLLQYLERAQARFGSRNEQRW